MAAELVGGAFLSSFLNVVFDRLSKPEVVNFIRGKKLNKKLLQRLERTLYVVQAVLNDAEQKQITDPAVKKWLANLEDAVYKADDLLDEVSTKAVIQKRPGNFCSRYLKFPLKGWKMVTKIEEAIGTLEDIAKHKDILGLERFARENLSWRIPSTSLVEKSDIIGREEDKEAILKLLLDDICDTKISVIPIVGMGGIGKTSLAQLVYNDDKVKQEFDFQAWVCVGEEFDVLKMTTTVLGAEAETSSSCNMNDLDSVQLHLKNKLTGKKFLVVLDDMWNDNYDDWKVFQNPFQYGSEGSKILVTTRNDKIASVVKTVPAYKLSLLSDEYCWLVFARHASLSTKSQGHSALEQVGRKIVEKCKGLPLAAQTLGGLLRTKDNLRDWRVILKSEIWEFSENESRILPALRISYQYLPSHLKRCFVYCSLYPKDYKFDRDELILLWMAEDLLQPPKSGGSLEEIGYEYFNDLASRSFFQPSSNTNENLFVMHDLMHDLATFYAGQFYCRASKLGSAAKLDIKTRHLSCDVTSNYQVSKFFEACDTLKHARTFLLINFNSFHLFLQRTSPYLSLSQLKYLRVLSFRSFYLNDSLCNSICELIHLRYLDLSKTPIMTLPEALSNLYNLQTLKLNGCSKLKMLPNTMQDLVNLRHLDIRETRCLKDMPKGMNKLKDLQFLSDYIVGKHEENGIKELGALSSLHGSLTISSLENVVNSFVASMARMFDKEHIDVLNLSWLSDGDGDIADSQTEADILDKLQPYIDLKELSIEGYRGTKFPNWFGNPSYRNMAELKLKGCNNCCMLPSLGQLPSLKHLWISDFHRLVRIDVEFYKNDEFSRETPFPSLETLKFHRMPCWQVWQSFQFDAFPQLKLLEMQNCPMLMGNLPNQLLALKKLTIEGCNQLACSLPVAPAILELQIEGTQEVRMQVLPVSLQSLSISGSQQVELVFEAMTHTQPTCLQFLRIKNCSSAMSFTGACLPVSLQELNIYNCENLEFPIQRQQQHESLQSLVLCDSCASLTSFPLMAFPNLTELIITRCENLKSLDVSQSRDAAFTSLRTLIIYECPSFVSLLSQSQNAALPSLHHLRIYSCPNFVSFSSLDLAAPQLEFLEIWSCPEIGSFAEGDGVLPPNLRDLFIIGCEQLVRCIASSTLLSNHSLTRLVINGACESVKSFPRESWLPASLQSLYLGGFPNLETLDCNGLLHLTFLQYLSIIDCAKLENMAGERLPASVMDLSIFRCPLLGERFKMKDSQIWPKVSHLRKIEVDWKQIS